MCNLYVRKGISKKSGKEYVALVGEDVFGTFFISFDSQVVMRVSGMSAFDIANLPVGDNKI